MSKNNMAIWTAAVLLCIAGITLFMLLKSKMIEQPIAEIYVGGELYRTVDLQEDTEFIVQSEYGSNTVKVASGKISVIAADCPDKVCIRSGGIAGGAVPIICLPHRLEIRIVSNDTDDVDIQIR